jgi:hypothetical protein
MMCELCSIKDFIVHWGLPLLCLFELRNFETIQYVLCHRKFSYMINQKFMKLCTLQDPKMKICTLVGYPGPLSFTRVLCFFGLRNFETIQCALCHRKFSHMINQKFMKLCTLQDPKMKMCTLVVYPGPSSFPRIMSLKVVFQICFGSIKMMGTQRVLVLRSGQLSYSIYVSMRDFCVQQYL